MTTIREWPRAHRGAIESQFYLKSSGVFSTSPYSGEQTAYGPQVQRFMCKVTFAAKRAPDWRELSGFISSLRGISNFLRMVDYSRMKTGYDAALTPATTKWSDNTNWDDGEGWAEGSLPPFVTVGESAPRDSDSIVLHGLPASLPRVLRMGDLVEIRPNGVRAAHGHLYEIVRDSRSSASGQTRIYFEPGLRAGVAAGDQAVLRYPSSVFRLVTDDEGIISRSRGNLGALGLTLSEILP